MTNSDRNAATEAQAPSPTGRDPVSGRFVGGNGVARNSAAWAKLAFTPAERRQRAIVARALERRKWGLRRACNARASQYVLARRFLADLAGLDGAARVGAFRDASRAADLILSIELAMEPRARASAGVELVDIPC